MSVSRRSLAILERRSGWPPSFFVCDGNNFVKQSSVFRTAKQTKPLLKHCFWAAGYKDFTHYFIERHPSGLGLCAVCLFDLRRKIKVNSHEDTNVQVDSIKNHRCKISAILLL